MEYKQNRSDGVVEYKVIKRASSDDDAGVSSVLSSVRRCRRRGGKKADKGHQKRHQEWLDKFGEVKFTPLVASVSLRIAGEGRTSSAGMIENMFNSIDKIHCSQIDFYTTTGRPTWCTC